MKSFLKKIPFAKELVQRVRLFYSIIKSHFRLKKAVKSLPLNIVVGSSSVFSQGWIPTDIEYLNLLKPSDWERYFKKNKIDVILAEHVWEHLSLDDGLIAARQCYSYLKSGGNLRVAVPDGNHPDLDYIKHVDVGSDDHKVLYDYKTFCKLFEKAGFSVELLEYFDEYHEFHYNEWDADKGKIHRSKRFDKRNIGDNLKYTSIILDAYK